MRFLLLAIFASTLWSQQPKPPILPEDPPEEDESLKPKEYVLNPLQAQKEWRTGNFYFKKGTWKAAASRYKEATLWDPSYADAFLKLGETYDRMKLRKEASEAYAKYVELEPDSKRAAELKRRLKR